MRTRVALMSAPTASLVLALIFGGGCASMFKMTPAQETTYLRFEQCKTATGSMTAQLERVNPNGSFSYTAREGNEFSRMRYCLQEKGVRWGEDPVKPRP